MGARGRGGRLGALAVALATAAVAAGATAGTAAAATPAPVPCSAIGSGKYDCQFYPAGDGISAGAPVQASDSSRVGFLNQGTNWVLCQETGSTVISGPYENNWWAYTEANDGRFGWVNAVWAKGGANFGAYQAVPACAASVGVPPGGTAAAPPPSSGGSGGSTGVGSTGGGSTGSTITPTPSPTPAPSSSPPKHARRHLRVAIELNWHVAARQTHVVDVRFLHLPARAHIAIVCRGPRCRVHTRAMGPRAARRALSRAFTVGDVLRVTITRHGFVPEVALVRFRRGQGPRGSILSR